MSDNLRETGQWLIHSPVFFVLVTLAAYRLGRELKQRTAGHALAQPVLVAVVLVGGLISVLGVDYQEYRAGTEIIAFWLGPAIVALAVPLHRQLARLQGFLVPMLVAIVLGSLVSVASVVLLAQTLGADDLLVRTLAPTSTSTPVAILLSDTVGGLPPLSAVLAVIAGILGAVAGPAVLDLIRVHDRRARGLALGAVSHGIGTSRALLEDPAEGAFSGLAMGLTALSTSLLLPVVLALLA